MNYKSIRTYIEEYLSEDVGDGDHTSLATIAEATRGKAHLMVKQNGILAGVNVAVEIFKVVDEGLQLKVFLPDGAPVIFGDIAFEVEGSVHSILKAERLVLNCMQRMSAIATQTHRITQLIGHTKARLLDTRKTTPGFRIFEKQAVLIGGGINHRFGLYDMILIKDNHVDYSGGVSKAISNTHQYLAKHQLKMDIEVEVRNQAELAEAIETGGIKRILLDNFTIADLKTAVATIAGRFETEASGGITIDNVLQYAGCGVDYISIGALTHSVNSLDLSLKAFT